MRFLILQKDSGRIVSSAKADAFFSFHHVNAYEEDGHVVVDLAAYPDASVIDQLYLSRLRSDAAVTATAPLTRFRIDVSGRKDVAIKVLSDAPIELPRIDYRRRAGQPYRVVYGAGNRIPGNFIDSLVKVNVLTGEFITWYADGCYPGEPVFVASPDSDAEDEA